MQIDDLLRRQGGVISRAQATALGMSLRTVQRRVASGAWLEVAPGVFLTGGHRLTDEVRVRAAWLWAGPTSLISGPAAAFWHRLLDHPGRVVDVAVAPSSRRRPPSGVATRRREIDCADRAEIRGVALTGLGLTVLETAAVVRDGAAFLDRALQRHLDFDDLYAAYCRAVGTRGMAKAGILLVAAADRADSALERRLIGLLRTAGITGFVVGHPFGDRAIDLAFPAARLAVEIDGWAFHADRARFAADRRKGNDLLAAGWGLLRFTWDDVMNHPVATVARVRNALARAA
ncbi:type IV toxin-antitoxin system AbiEi family antitoxin domain-containing protein [Pseudonocardia sp. KRD291]|uniref:type IV toxin-antitoxin system AbiEi family antitoxin domain-containing protein n=1 Tax=Pseudonocardia sp. KRD291 TaxID=2792007 RepID=UPI001C49DB34|nr:type IV toxin-antitoxin system AbiEi family antitoxin domain-containing protein [Pseudonocardia sp. KRD291]MBW0105480.1 type IV toxin-antitoxin system AbiEi family antitoxin domain-containing protein [Pseudonocardia sp. KRD291]